MSPDETIALTSSSFLAFPVTNVKAGGVAAAGKDDDEAMVVSVRAARLAEGPKLNPRRMGARARRRRRPVVRNRDGAARVKSLPTKTN